MPTYKKISELTQTSTADSTDIILYESASNGVFAGITLKNLASAIVDTGEIKFSEITSSGDSVANTLQSDLDVGSYQIVSSSNADIGIMPNGTGEVYIGPTAPTNPGGLLHIYNGGAEVTGDSVGDELIVQNAGDAGLSIISPDGSDASIVFGTPDDPRESRIWHSDSVLNVLTLSGLVIHEADTVDGVGLINDTASDTAGNNLTKVEFRGTEAAGTTRNLAKIEASKSSSGTTDSGVFALSVSNGSSYVQMLHIDGNSLALGEDEDANTQYDVTLPASGLVYGNNAVLSDVATLGVANITGLSATTDEVSINGMMVSKPTLWRMSPNNDPDAIISTPRPGAVNSVVTEAFDPSSAETTTIVGQLPKEYNASGCDIEIAWYSTEDSGTVSWGVIMSALSGTDSTGSTLYDVTSDYFLDSVSQVDSVTTTAGGVQTTTLTLNDSAQTSWADAGAMFKLNIIRNATADTMNADAQVLGVQVVGV